MAEPVRFCGFNKRLTAPPGYEDKVKTLHVHSDGKENISCWKFSLEELEQVVANGGEFWITVKSGQTAPPIFASGFALMEAKDADTGEPTTYYSDGRHIVEDARRFAILHHGDQMYGDKPYSYHTAGVAQVLRDFGADWPFLVAAHIHDVEEDCLQDLPVEERRIYVAERFGSMCEAMVWACTGLMFVDDVKQNRKARNLQQYAKIQALPQAAPVKIADRIFNMEECVRTKGPMGRPYFDEVLEFDVNVGVHCPPEMRRRLFDAALAIAAYNKTKPELIEPVRARREEIAAQINMPTQEAA